MPDESLFPVPCATILVDRLRDCPWPMDGHRIITVSDYAGNPQAILPGSHIVNLCRNRYLSRGYYGSLLAQARGHAVVPSVATLINLNCRALQGPALDRLNRSLALIIEDDATAVDLHRSLPVFFGRVADARLHRLGALAFELFPCPMLTLDFDARARKVKGVRGMTGQDVQAQADGSLFRDAMERWLSGLRAPPPRNRKPRPRLAVLHDPSDPFAPSKPGTLERFRRVGEDLGLGVEMIRHRDAARLAGFDALFIRETTGVLHPSFRLASLAADLGMPVIDDPHSILLCCNKVYLAERLRRHGIPTPRTMITDGRDLDLVGESLGYPLVLKTPDGSNSRGVFKAHTPQALEHTARRLLDAPHLIIAQEYLYTPFDWRVTLLAGQVLFACRYHMADGHWQILRHGADGRMEEGATECVPMAAVPDAVIDTAVRAAALIGNGLYGVDLKETADGVRVIEINDNPNIDIGLEDSIVGDQVYKAIIEEFISRIGNNRDVSKPLTQAAPPMRLPAIRSSGVGGFGTAHGRIAVARHNRV